MCVCVGRVGGEENKYSAIEYTESRSREKKKRLKEKGEGE